MPEQKTSRDAVQQTVVNHNDRPGAKPEEPPPGELLPHDRDQAAGATGGIPDAGMQQAHRDLQRGLRDTDRGVVADQTYRKLKDGRSSAFAGHAERDKEV